MRSFLSGFLVICFGVFLLWTGTDGFRAFTAEGARRLAVLEQPRPLPAAALQDQDGRMLNLQDYKGQYLLVTFMYTRCAELCPILEANFKKIYQGIDEEHLGKQVSMLSISFDPEFDMPQMLKYYAGNFEADGESWKIARVPEQKVQEDLLEFFGVVVIPAGVGRFEHNGAFYIVDPDGRLIEILDYDKPELVLEKVKALLSDKTTS